MSMFPKVNVVLPFYGDAETLDRAILSILNQTYKEINIIVGLDGPNPNAKVILSKYKSEKIELIEYPRRGFICTLNDLMLYSIDCDFIARMDGDDWSSPNRIEEQVNFLTRRSEYAFVSSNYGYIGRNNKKVIESRLDTLSDYFEVSATDLLNNNRDYSFNICDPCMMYRAISVKEVGYYDLDIDNERPLQIKILRKYKGAVLSSPLYFCDYNLDSHSRSKSNDALYKKEQIVTKYILSSELSIVENGDLGNENNLLGPVHRGLRIYLEFKSWGEVISLLLNIAVFFNFKTWKIIIKSIVGLDSTFRRKQLLKDNT